MASITLDPGGRRRILFVDPDSGARRAIRLGRIAMKPAESFKGRVEALVAAAAAGIPWDADLAAWTRSLPDSMHARLAAVGLVAARVDPTTTTLGALIERFVANADVAAATRAAYPQTFKSLVEFFGADKPLGSIAPGDADDWRKSIAGSGIAKATVSKRVRTAKALFARAVRWKLIPQSPLADLVAGPQSNPDRAFYVPRETVEALLAECPDDDWRAIIALSRFAGLRVPSELALLRWGDVDWARGRMHVRSPKTARHEGHASRIVPISPELRPILQRLFDAAEPGTEAVVGRVGCSVANLRTGFGRIIARAGFKPWPRLFHAMRGSCATDWVERFPSHTVAGWLGHSERVAATHYLTTRDENFARAAGLDPDLRNRPLEGGAESGAESGALGAQNAAQHASAPVRRASAEMTKTPCFPGVSRANATACGETSNLGNGPGQTRTADLTLIRGAL